MNWKNLRVGTKLYVGFGIVLVLALAIGFVGYNGLDTVSQKVANAQDADQLVKWIKDMGASRAKFVYTQDKVHYEDVDSVSQLVTERMSELQSRLQDPADIATVDNAFQSIDQYMTLWQECVGVSDEAKASMSKITAAANVLQAKAEEFQADQSELMKAAFIELADRSEIRSRAQKLEASNDIIYLWAQARIQYRNWKISGADAPADLFVDFVQQLGEVCRSLEGDLAIARHIAQMEEITSAVDDMQVQFANVRQNNEQMDEIFGQLGTVAVKIVDEINHLQQVQMGKTASAQASAVTMAIGFVIGAVLIGVFVAWFIARGISKPTGQMAYVAEQIALGDVNQNIEVDSKDEIGVLADAFRRLIDYMKELAGAAERIADNDLTVQVEPKSEDDVLGNSFKTMVANLGDMIRQLNQNATELVTAATEIASSSEQMSRGANDQTQQMSQISTAVEEMTATIVESSKNAGDASSAAGGASETASQGGAIVNETIQGMQRIASVVRESADSIQKLASSADQIGEIIGVIDDIADQTNLLALNAAIEAARAGEQGRGFAVVADEVRKLAERTGKATGEITDMIKGIQTETQEAVQSMETGIGEVDKGRELADNAGNSLSEIVSVSQRVMDMIQQIATAAEEQSSAAEQISKNVENVASITKETATGAEQSAAAAEELNRQAEGLKLMVGKFRV
ncbi:HAMP domain-containing protein [candidate division GN15 bacterium]|nr:HAMP domain-containing protein [candidate division GN15 bacterium]